MCSARWRSTVSLESLIRLSEAIAKANCVDDVTEVFVREAFSLLRQSIISVEKDDVDVDEDDEDIEPPGHAGNQDDDESAHGDSSMADSPSHATPTPSNQQGQRPKTKITYDKYMSILNLLVRKVNTEETTTGEGVEGEDLVVWYLEQKEEEFDTQEDMESERELVGKVLKRMVKVWFSPRKSLTETCFSIFTQNGAFVWFGLVDRHAMKCDEVQSKRGNSSAPTSQKQNR